ncbi:MAG: adenylosuccinate synthase, partial [Verrucomicrobiota bacterium]
MANTILVGAQWGDEGKGKIIDVLTEAAEIVVRTQGGNNAGHTVFIGKKKYVLHLVPSGILRRGKICVIGNGVVVDPVSLVDEIDHLERLGVRVKNLCVSESCHLVLPYHRELDSQRETLKGKNKIGTTKRGIGPAYGDKAARTGLRMIDLINPARFQALLRCKIKENNEILRAFGAKPLSFPKVLAQYRAAGDRLKPFVTNTVVLLHEATRRNAEILFEGAQGTFLDIDHGTYPFVTSSNTTAGGACTGSGVAPHRMERVVGVMKAYTTRVGEGPLPTESAEIADLLHGMGREFGATTGRARRCGWFDAVATHYAAIINGIDEIAVTNLDGLDTVETIKVCIAYRAGSARLDYMP